MEQEFSNQDLNRRGFLRTAAAAALAAIATGTGAAIISKRELAGSVSIPSLPELQSLPVVTSAKPGAPDQVAQLAAVQAENVRLQTRLAAAEAQLELNQRLADGQLETENQTWQAKLADAQGQVTTLNGRVNVLAGLVGLYEQLDEIDLAAIAGSGLVSVGGLLATLTAEVPALAAGIATGQEALTELEEQIPSLEESQRWLNGQINLLGQFFGDVEASLQEAIEATGSFLSKLNQWFEDILKWLPFGLGKRAATIMGALGQLLGQVPETLSGFDGQVTVPLDNLLAKEDGQTRLQRRIIKPVREQALSKAAETAGQVQALQETYQVNLAEPVQQAVSDRQMIREQISAYRQKNLV